jgi:hypothetical protein
MFGGIGAFSTSFQSKFAGMACGHFTLDSARASAPRQCTVGAAGRGIDACGRT